jgi:hypothetical protein
MYKFRYLFFVCVTVFWAEAFIVDPVVDTDKSVNTYSVETIVADLIDNGMSDVQKLDALFTFHRRIMHHYRFTSKHVESDFISFDIIQMYHTYGAAWCTQHATIFRTLCSEVFGWNNTQGTAGQGTLVTSGQSGGHSSFMLRYNAGDQWHWVDPIIGAYARNKTDGKIASLNEIRSNPSILIDAVADGRASVPYFPCNTGINPIAGNITAAYSYFDYDTAYIIDFAQNWGNNQWTSQAAYFTNWKTLKKGETYLWHWDFLEGDYFNLHDGEDGAYDRTWQMYPPRHICGWKDSLETKNWPYFKPYAKSIKGNTCYRYYANGIHTFAPDLKTVDPKDDPYTQNNIAFNCDDGGLPHIRPTASGSPAEIAYRIKIPYPIMSMRITGAYVKKDAGDNLVLSIGKTYFNRDDSRHPVTRQNIPEYRDTLTTLPFVEVHNFAVNPGGSFDLPLRDFVDPIKTDTTYYGYIIKFSMQASGSVNDVGINDLKVECIFQHNMFALPQLEPGANNVTVTVGSGNLAQENLKLAFSWMDNGSQQYSQSEINTSPTTYGVNVSQQTIPRMMSMALGNTREANFGVEDRPGQAVMKSPMVCFPNPFNSAVKIMVKRYAYGVRRVSSQIYDINGKLVKDFTPYASRITPYTFTWNANRLPAGIYLLKLQTDKKTYTKKILRVK